MIVTYRNDSASSVNWLLRLASVADRVWPVVHLSLQCHLYVVTCIGDGYFWPGRNRAGHHHLYTLTVFRHRFTVYIILCFVYFANATVLLLRRFSTIPETLFLIKMGVT